jgi:crossover junction endodeoxyribonuclease RusA
MIRVTLPYPDKRLSQNARVHWATRATLTHKARFGADMLTRNALGIACLAQVIRADGLVPIAVEIAPPDKRRRDLQNTIGALKAAIDGVSDALGVDDCLFAIRWPETFSAPVKGGQVILTIGEG